MSTPATTPSPSASMPGSKQQLLDAWEQEHARTLRVLRAYPKDKLDLKPHPKAKSARDLAFMFVSEQFGAEKALTTGFDWSKPQAFPPAPESLEAILAIFEENHRRITDLIRSTPEEKLFETIPIPTAPGEIRDRPRIAFVWMMVSDQIHHRGQFSVYLRMAGGRVPSIYGPSLDEPWS